MVLLVITPPAAAALSLEDAKAWLQITSPHEDAVTQLAIDEATELVERTLKRALITRTVELVLDAWPVDPFSGEPSCLIRLPLPPLASVTSVKYLDPNGVEQTLDAGKWHVPPSSIGYGFVVLKSGECWPAISPNLAAIRVRYLAGFGTDASALPATVKRMLCEATGLILNQRMTGAEVQTAISRMAAGFEILEYV